ncbi:MAG: CBS domain-containing protein, partial [Clostridiales bacterium]|nr:CBS domain-containing protein [Clostridiales bacterium]
APERRKERTLELLELVNLDPGTYLGRYPSDLSGGQKQRIGLLRALATEPPIILMDEPFGALDPITRDSLQDEIKKLQKKLKKTIVFVTHDMDEAIRIADVIILMKDGKIVQSASPEELLSNPADEFVEQFIGKHRMYSGTVAKVSDVMRPNPFTVSKGQGMAQTIALMRAKSVSGLIVVDDDERPLGYIGIENIMDHAKSGVTIGELEIEPIPTITEDDPAVDAFAMLTKERAELLAVINGGGKVVGVVTKTSMVSSLARIVWNEGPVI